VLTNQEGVARKARRAVRCAETLREIETAWRLVYEVYLAQGIIEHNPYRIHTTPPAVSPHSCTVFGESQGEAVSTLTMIRDSRCGLPLDKVMGDKLDKLRSAGRRLVETGMLADRRVHPTRSLRTLFELMRWAIYFTLSEGADDIVVGVHPRHVGFYRRAFSADLLSEVRRYRELRAKPVVLLRCRVRERLLSAEPLYRGLQFAALNPLAGRVFANRYRFPRNDVSKSHWMTGLGGNSEASAAMPVSLTGARTVRPATPVGVAAGVRLA